MWARHQVGTSKDLLYASCKTCKISQDWLYATAKPEGASQDWLYAFAKLVYPTITSSCSYHRIVTQSIAQMHITQHLHPSAWEDQPTTIWERLNNYINDHGMTNLPPCWKSLEITSTTMGGTTYHHVGKLNIYINDHGRTNLPPCQKIFINYINDHGMTNLQPCRKDWKLHQQPWEDQPTTMSKNPNN